MLIVGCRGRGGFEGMNLGSVAQAVAHYSPCPVGIVHPPGCQPGPGRDDSVDGGSTISSDAVVALAWAIDAATDRGDMDQAARLASLRGAELDRWLEARGYPGLVGGRARQLCQVTSASGRVVPAQACSQAALQACPYPLFPAWWSCCVSARLCVA